MSNDVELTKKAFDTDKLFSAFHICLQLLLASLMVSIAVAEILVGIVTILWVMLMVRGVRYRRTGLDVPILVFICARLLSIIFSEYPSMSYNTVTRELVYYVSFFFTVFYLQHTEREKMNSLMKILFGSTVAVTVISVSMFLLGYAQKVNTLGGGGMLSTHLAFLIPVVLITKDNKSVFRKPLLFWLTLLIFLIGLSFSLTRGDWLATAVCLIIYGAVFNRKLVFGLILFTVVFILILPNGRYRLTTLVHPFENTSDRLTLWNNAFNAAGAHPFLGYGPGTFHVIFTDVEHLWDKKVGAWHNDVLQLYMESGFAGVASFLFLVVVVIIFSLKLIRHDKARTTDFNVGWMGILVILAYLISGMFTMPTISITNGMLFRFLIAIVAVEHQRLAA